MHQEEHALTSHVSFFQRHGAKNEVMYECQRIALAIELVGNEDVAETDNLHTKNIRPSTSEAAPCILLQDHHDLTKTCM